MRLLFKVVRDRIPSIIQNAGGWCLKKQLVDLDEWRHLLKKKLVEEAKEVLDAHSKEAVISELADLYAVADQIRLTHAIPLQDIELAKRLKEAKNGGFANGEYVYIAHGGKI